MAKRILPIPIFDTLTHCKNFFSPLLPELSFARSDAHCVWKFLQQYDGSEATFNTYRAAVERLLQWTWYIQQQSILTLQAHDIEAHIKFCQHPPKSWISTKIVARFITKEGQRIPNSAWRPFIVKISKAEHTQGNVPDKVQYLLSSKAVKEIFVILGSFYHHLESHNIVGQNPVKLIRQKSKFIRHQQTLNPIPRLTELQWNTVLSTVKAMGDERTCFIIHALYYLYLRISELTTTTRWVPVMCHFFQDHQKNWWFKTVGKGNKERIITVSDEMLSALTHWRQYLKLSPLLPQPNDKSPLLPKLIGQGGISSTRHIRRLVEKCFTQAIEKLNALKQPDAANSLAFATVHWLRHTGISDDINLRERPIAHVRDDAGHASINTTDRYNNITLEERHRSGKSKQTTAIAQKKINKPY